jgi:nucleoside-triphosphatase
MKKNVLVTGYPGVGKTTLIKRIRGTLRLAGGFYTEEIREGKTRTGFKVITFEGKEGLLAHKGIISPYRVGKYGINIKDLEEIGVKSILQAVDDKRCSVVVIDEIGKMELFSPRFQDAVAKALDSPKRILATAPINSGHFIKRIKLRSDVATITVDISNRDSLPDQIIEDFLRSQVIKTTW